MQISNRAMHITFCQISHFVIQMQMFDSAIPIGMEYLVLDSKSPRKYSIYSCFLVINMV